MKNHPEHSALLQFDSLNNQAGIAHFVTTRKGGVSKGPFSSFNMGNYSDDCSIDIYENRQTDKIEALYGIDASITHLKDLFICATTADCVPILLYDKKLQIIAAIHAGWKGIVGNIIENTIAKMKEAYNTNPSHIVAAIGPSISQKNYEVGDELITEFNKSGFDLSSATLFNQQTNKWHIDLKLVSHNELVRLGVVPNQIETSTLCTYDESELFFSARRQTIVSGRMLSGIKLID